MFAGRPRKDHNYVSGTANGKVDGDQAQPSTSSATGNSPRIVTFILLHLYILWLPACSKEKKLMKYKMLSKAGVFFL